MPTTFPKETREERYNKALDAVLNRCLEADQKNTCRNQVVPYSEEMMLANAKVIAFPVVFAIQEAIASLRELLCDTRILTTIL